ncbi:MAG: response regulator [Alphaproteobacteria bacterium]|nr:response regulator [Alphaproteobacteria bacterium]
MRGLASLHALVVDDNPQMRLLIRTLLRGGGLTRISEAETADEALDIARKVNVDLVFADWLMRPTDGLSFVHALRRSKGRSATAAIVMVSAHSEASRVLAARDAGVNAFLVKPISARSLFHHLSAALNDERPFVRTTDYVGPDRRRGGMGDYFGPRRRASDVAADVVEIG